MALINYDADAKKTLCDIDSAIAGIGVRKRAVRGLEKPEACMHLYVKCVQLSELQTIDTNAIREEGRDRWHERVAEPDKGEHVESGKGARPTHECL